jgi:hypothetical protein
VRLPMSVRLDAKTESLIGRLARRRRQTKSEVIRDPIGVFAKQEEKGGGNKRPTIWARPSDRLRGQRRPS